MAIKKFVAFIIAMVTVSVIAIIGAVKTGNAEHWIQAVVSAAITLSAAFDLTKKIKNGKKD